jgi:hypothetical protein
MLIGYFAYQLPLWACIALALLPPMVIILLFRLVPHRYTADESARQKHQIVLGILSTAFVFTVSLSTNTVWSEDQQIYTSANKIVQTNLASLDQVGYAAPDELSEGQMHFRQLLEALPDDINEVSIAASSASKQQMYETQQWIASLNLPDKERTVVDGLAATLQQEWYEWLVAINASGLPDVIWMVIGVLGLLLVATVTLLPWGAQQRYETAAVFGFGLAVGILQVPLWVLNSQGFANVLAGSVFNEFTASPPAVGRLMFGVAVFALLAGAFFMVLKLVDRRLKTRRESVPSDASAT